MPLNHHHLILHPELISLSLCLSVYRWPSSPVFPRPLVSLLSGAAHALHALVELALPSRELEAPQLAALPHLTHPSVHPSSHSPISAQRPSASTYSRRSEVSPQEGEGIGPVGRGK